MVGLKDKADCRPAELSGGEQQRVSLARALVNNPSLIIADEPTGNIDPEMSFEIIELLNEINKQGTTIIVVTHEHELVQKFKNRVIEINNGKVTGDSGATAEKTVVPIKINQESLAELPKEIKEEIADVSADEINEEALKAINEGEADDL